MAFATQIDGLGLADRAAHGRAAMPLAAERVEGADWDRLTADFDGLCQEQIFAYAKARWPGVSIEPVIFRKGGEVVGGTLVMIQKLPLGLGAIALVKWGPILKSADAPEAGTAWRGMVEALIEDYAGRRAMMVSIMPRAQRGPGNAALEMLLDRGFVLGPGLRAPDRYVVDVRLDDEARMAGFSQKWRYHLRKALAADLAFEPAGAERLGDFLALYREMVGRKRFHDFSGIATLPELMAMPEGTARPHLFFVSKDGVPLAGAVVFSAGLTATYLYGATNAAALPARAGYFLHWHILGWLRAHSRARAYDLGGTDGFSGLHQFKSGMVGTRGYIAPLPPVANYASARRARWAGTLAYRGRAALTGLRDRAIALRQGPDGGR